MPAPRRALRARSGRIAGQINASRAAKLLEELEPADAVATARYELSLEFLDDLRRIDEQLRETKKRIAAIVAASKTSTTEIFGVRPRPNCRRRSPCRSRRLAGSAFVRFTLVRTRGDES